jgi:hypothetical protein
VTDILYENFRTHPDKVEDKQRGNPLQRQMLLQRGKYLQQYYCTDAIRQCEGQIKKAFVDKVTGFYGGNDNLHTPP